MSKNPKSIRTIGAEMPFKVGSQTIWKGLTREVRFTYGLLKKKICYRADKKVKRVLWAIDHIGWKSESSKVIFSDEKKFNLDRTDGLK